MPPKGGLSTTKAKAKADCRLRAKVTPKDVPTACVSKFRFKYLDSKRMEDLIPGSLYWDRVSLSVPCTEVWQKTLQDPRFSRLVESNTASASSSGRARPSRRLLTYPEMMEGRNNGKPLFNELAVFVYENVSDECRRQWAATQYWRARVKCFALWLRGPGAPEGNAARALGVKESIVADDLLDPAAMTKGSADPYYRRCRATTSDTREGDNGMDDDHYNSLRQSQRVAPTQVLLLNTLRMCYAEVSAPLGSLVLLRGQLQCRGKYVLAEYAERPEDELESWRLAEYDEPLSGYRIPVEEVSDEGKKTKRVAYPWRRRKLRVICEVPKEVLQARGSKSVNKQGSSSNRLSKRDVAMLRAYAAKVASKVPRASGRTATLKRPAAVAAYSAVGCEGLTNLAAKRRQDQKPTPQGRLAAATQSPARHEAVATRSPARLFAAPKPRFTRAAQKSFKSLYGLLESTHFPKGCRSSMSVTGFIPKNYLIFGLHRAARGTSCPNKLELTAATSFAFGKFGEDAQAASRLRSSPAQYRELLQALQKHLLEVGMQPAPQHGASRGILDPVSGQFIPEKQVRFTSVMVAKNKRTYFHKDGNNRGPSYQVVITDPDKVASGEFTGGNLLCWPELSAEEAARRTHEVLTFHEERKATRKERRDEHRQKQRELNPCNARWKGDNDEVREVGEEDKDSSESESDEDFVLHEKQVDIRNVKLEEDIEDVEDRSLDSRKVPAYEDDASVVECVNRYVSFVGRNVWHATQPWRATNPEGEKPNTTRCANRYCITFFAVDLKDGDGAVYKRELRQEALKMGFRPHDSDLATSGRRSGVAVMRAMKATLAKKKRRS